MIDVKDKRLCCGCTACYSSCPKKCIDMQMDAEGFLYPVVDKRECIDCKKCEKVCPFLNETNESEHSCSLYVGVQSKDVEERKRCTAGGFTTLISHMMYDEGAVVYGCAYENMHAIHKKALSKSDIDNFRGSKYVQSNIGNIYNDIKQNLNDGKKVLFIGTGCQVYGLKKYIGENDNLYLIDLLCLGVSSPGLFKKWIVYLETKYGRKINDIQFRNKKYGYSVPNVRIVFDDGKVIEQKYDSKVYSRLFFNYYNMRPSCYDCRFREIPRVSDITVGDFSNIGEYSEKMDDDTGVTQVWIHTKKGKKQFSKTLPYVNYIVINKSSTNIVGGKRRQAICPDDRQVFFEDSNKLDFSRLIRKWAPKTIKDDVSGIIRKGLNILPIKKQINAIVKKQRTKRFYKNVNKANDG